jgi:hypothetical protein
MRGYFSLPALLLTLAAFPGVSDGQSGTGTATTTVTANPSTITVGASLTLNATAQPDNVQLTPGAPFSKPSGTITFLDGSTRLNATPVAVAPSTFASQTFQQLFGLPSAMLTQQNVQGELTGDINGDGIPDLLVYAYSAASQTFYAQSFISNGKGGYSDASLQSPGVAMFSSYPNVTNIPVLVDLNGDGKLDLLDGILVAYGNGDGTFAPAVPVSFLASGFVTSYVADLNVDGKTDILAVNSIQGPLVLGPFQISITVFLNQGGGAFAPAGTFPVSAPYAGSLDSIIFFPPTFVDLNGDGKQDLVTQNQFVPLGQAGEPPNVEVLLNNGDGTFGSYTNLTVPLPPNNHGTIQNYGMGSGDLNGDGKQDLVLGISDGYGDSDAIILLGNGDGTFGSPNYLSLPSQPNVPPYFALQDINLDGHLDLVFGNGTLALGKGDGTFAVGTPLFPPNTNYPYAPLQMSLAGDPVPSLVFLLLPTTPPSESVFTPQTNSSGALSLTTLAVGTHSITARYSGDANYRGDTSAAVTVTVNQAISVTAVTSSVNPSSAEQSVTLTAKVTSNGPTPTGNVTFTAGSTTPATVALSGGSAAYTTTSFTTVGMLAINASYSGDANTKASSATLSQVVTGPTLTLSLPSITFPGQYVGTSGLPLTVTATNPGSAPLNITSVTTSSKAFGVLNACGGSLAAGSSCAIGVFFDPASSGAVNGTLTIADNASGSPQTIPLSGSGQDFSFTSSSSTQTVTPGSIAKYTIAVNPIAGFNQTVALSCSGAPTGSTCSLSSSSIALSGSTPASVTVSVTTQGNSAAAIQPRSPSTHGTQIPIFFAICGLPGLLLWGGWRSALGKRKTAAICWTALLGVVCFVVAGCGGNSSNPGGGTPANTYTLTVTGTFASGSATLTHSTNLTMVVQ